MHLYGLIGFPLAQSFSKKYFTEKFEKENIVNCQYELFEIPTIQSLLSILKEHKNLAGFNITIPYKEAIIPYLDEMDGEAESIGAFNCVKITAGKLKGYNTDAAAFETTLLDQLQPHHTHALILGTGGAAKAVKYTLQKLGIIYTFVTRNSKADHFTYDALTPGIMEKYTLIINTTPLGTYPNTNELPPILYEYISPRHYLYDLIYNPPVTAFLKEGKERGAIIKNGYDMLVAQAELSWNIWHHF